MRFRKLGTACILSITLLLAACATATVGQDFQEANLDQLQVGQTTLAQTVALLGAPPQSSLKTARGNWVHQWRFVRSDANVLVSKVEAKTKEVILVFDGDNVLIGLAGSSGIAVKPETLQRIQAVPRPAR